MLMIAGAVGLTLFGMYRFLGDVEERKWVASVCAFFFYSHAREGVEEVPRAVTTISTPWPRGTLLRERAGGLFSPPCFDQHVSRT